MSANSVGVYSHLFKCLPDNWTLLPLSEAVDFQEGPGILAVDFHENGIPLLRLSSITGIKTTFDGCNFLLPEKVAKKWAHFKLNEGDILLSTSGSLGRVSEVAKEQEGSICYTGIIRFRPKVEGLKKSFIKYFLQSSLFEKQASSSAAGSVLKHFGPSHLKQMSFPVPPEECQEFIEQLIEPLDNKIDLNRRINQTLEAMAQAIFKSWFVDFDPVKAKIAAKQEGRDPLRAAMSAISGKPDAELDALPPEQCEQLAAIAALFPDEMEESELGEIPKGWATQRVGNVLELAYGKALKSTDRQKGTVPVYGSGGITGYHNMPLVPHGSIVVGRKGTVGSLYWEDEPFFPIDTTYYVRPLAAPLTYCYYAMQTLGLENMNTDAAVPGLNRENVYRLELVRPDSSVLQKFDSEVSTLRNAIHTYSDSNKALANLRDTLLPKLLSGELSVAEAIGEVEA